MNTAAKGRRNEHRSMAQCEAIGFLCVRAAGSKGLWDFVAIRHDLVLLVQVKSTDMPSPAERQALANCKVPSIARKVIHRWKKRARTPDVWWWDEFVNDWVAQ